MVEEDPDSVPGFTTFFTIDFDKNYISKVMNILLSTAIFYSKKNSVIKVLNKELFNEIQKDYSKNQKGLNKKIKSTKSCDFVL